MRKALLLIGLAGAAFGQTPSAVAKVTFYREKVHSNLTRSFRDGFVKGHEDDVISSRAYWKLFVDGKEFTTVKTNHFITIELPPGKHEFRASRSERIQLDLHSGERTYVRLGLWNHILKLGLTQQTVRVVPCSEALEDVAHVQPEPVKGKNVKWGDIADEPSFPSDCGGSPLRLDSIYGNKFRSCILQLFGLQWAVREIEERV